MVELRDYMGRGDDVMEMIPKIECLRMTKHGHPEHPCYITYEVDPIPFNRAAINGRHT